MKEKQSCKKVFKLFSVLLLFITNIALLGMNIQEVRAEEKNPRIDGVQQITANDLKWLPVSEENQLGGADDFNAIFFDKFSNFNETGAPVAAKKFENIGNVTFKEGQVGGTNQFSDYSIPRYNVGIIAQDSIDGKIRVQNGDAVLGNSVDPEKIDKDSTTDEGSIFIRQEQINEFM